MCMVQEKTVIGPATFICAQSGCRPCLEDLMGRHEGLVHGVIRRSWVGVFVNIKSRRMIFENRGVWVECKRK